MALLELTHLNFSYRVADQEIKILEDVNLKVEPGEFLGLLGPSGSGKSTLFYLIGCMLKPTSGHIFLEGQDLSALNSDGQAWVRNHKIGFIFQQFHLLPGSSVWENIMLPAHYPSEMPHSVSEKTAHAQKLTTRLNIDHVLKNSPAQLSGGQQQRVAIARALLNDVSLILADEPTGNLDSKNAAEVMALLKELNREGKTIVIITHDLEVAKNCSRIVRLRDGHVIGDEITTPRDSWTREWKSSSSLHHDLPSGHRNFSSWLNLMGQSIPLAVRNLKRNKTKSALTMLGVTVGIAAVLAMLTAGQFIKAKILEGYQDMGVNRLSFVGYHNWHQRATDRIPATFQDFDVGKDILPLKKIFPSIELLSPIMRTWQITLVYAGKTLNDDIKLMGVSPDYLAISDRRATSGTVLSQAHVDNRSAVCMIGTDIVAKLYQGMEAVGTMLLVSAQGGRRVFPCRVIGVLDERQANDEWVKPNLHVLLPYTYFQAVVSGGTARAHEFTMKVNNHEDVEDLSNSIKAYFNLKYGASGEFRGDRAAVVVEQMKKFLTLFTLLLTFIALVSLTIGGVGINNMMLVSVSERLREIGIRKALGATNVSVRVQLLTESVLLCMTAGFLGLAIGFSTYQLIIWGASKFVEKVHFAWVFNPLAMAFSFVSILIVGVASGVVPALKAEKIQVIEALRSE